MLTIILLLCLAAILIPLGLMLLSACLEALPSVLCLLFIWWLFHAVGCL